VGPYEIRRTRRSWDTSACDTIVAMAIFQLRVDGVILTFMSLVNAMRWQMDISREAANTSGRLANGRLDMELVLSMTKFINKPDDLETK